MPIPIRLTTNDMIIGPDSLIGFGKHISMGRDVSGESARIVITSVIGASFKAKIELRIIPLKKGITRHQRSTSFLDPMCMDFPATATTMSAEDKNWMPTRVHGTGKA
jgi:hypothetical protein